MGDRPHRDIRQPRQTVGQEAQGHALAGARIAMDHRDRMLAVLGAQQGDRLRREALEAPEGAAQPLLTMPNPRS